MMEDECMGERSGSPTGGAGEKGGREKCLHMWNKRYNGTVFARERKEEGLVKKKGIKAAHVSLEGKTVRLKCWLRRSMNFVALRWLFWAEECGQN